ncbi:MAG: hypothetical protein Q8S33_00235 [Myxococcales bacterium]|nr:hypothetical protein [Myxococcales bacterium]
MDGVTHDDGAGVLPIGFTRRSTSRSTAVFITPSLAPGKYVFLGFFDVDGNGTTSKEPDQGDPVTLALTNTFDIVDGQQTRRSILFELVFN